MWHVLRHNMHHALSSSVAERALRIRLLQLCLTSGELAVLLCLMIAGDTSIVVSVTCPQTRPLTHTATATVGAAAPWRPVRSCEYHLNAGQRRDLLTRRWSRGVFQRFNAHTGAQCSHNACVKSEERMLLSTFQIPLHYLYRFFTP